MNKKKLAALACGSVLLISALSGCGSNGPKDAAELLEQYNAGDHKNSHMVMNIDMKMNMGVMGQSIEVPMLMKMDMDMVGDNVHGNMNISMSMMGQDVNQDAEMYAEKDGDSVVTYVESNGMWVKQDQDATALTGYQENLMKKGMFDDAEFSYDKEKKEYTIVQNMAKLVDNEDYKDAMESLNLFQSSGLDASMYEGLIDAMSKCTNTYVFDENLNMISSKMSELSYQTQMEQSGMTFDVDLTMNMDIEGSKFGEIKEEDVITPDDVKEKAISMSGTQTPQVNSTEATTEATTEAKIEDTEESTEDNFIRGGTNEELPYDEEVPGSVNGVALTEGPDSFEKTFGAAGYTLDPEKDGKYSFAACKNPDCGADLYVFPEDRNENPKNDDIIKNGFCGYGVSYYGYGDPIDMKWKNGITWEATPEEVIAAYGEPSESSTQKDKSFIMLTYRFDNHTTIEFIFTDSGLHDVTFSNFKYIYDK